MKYGETCRGIFFKRPNRFIAQVLIDDEETTVHVKNTGRCKELLVPGATVILERAENPNRKTPYDLIAVYKGSAPVPADGEEAASGSAGVVSPGSAKAVDSGSAGVVSLGSGEEGTSGSFDFLINMDSQAPNKVVGEWLAGQGFDLVKPEYTYGKSRVDFYMERGGDRYLLEVKGCTLEIDGIGFFPDAPTQRGVKHLNELAGAIAQGYHCAVAFAIQMEGITQVLPNVGTHPEFGEALAHAKEAGVEVLCLPCVVKEDELAISSGVTWENAVS